MASSAASQPESQTSLSLNVEAHNSSKVAISVDTIDIIERDPNDMNEHLKVQFEELFAEPHPTIYSFDGVWTTSYKVFRTTKMWCYRITTLLFAVPASIFWGINFALVACCTIWCYMPCIRTCEIELQCIKGIYLAMINTFIKPCYEAMGFCFHNFRIHLLQSKGDHLHNPA